MLYPPWGKIKHGAASQECSTTAKTPPDPDAYGIRRVVTGAATSMPGAGTPPSHAANQLAPPGLVFFSRSTNGVRISIGTGKTMVVLLSPAMLPSVCR